MTHSFQAAIQIFFRNRIRHADVVLGTKGFAGNDQLKTNAVLIMRAKGVTKFQTI